MPKPENPGQHGRYKRRKGQTIEKWLRKGYDTATLVAGETEIEEIPLDDPETQSVVLGGHIFDSSGRRVRGLKPHFSITETDTGALITVARPSSRDITIVYKIVDDVGDEDEDESPVVTE